MDNDFPLAASRDSTHLRSLERSRRLRQSIPQRRDRLVSHPPPAASLFLRSHRYPEQHDKNNNALFTGQYIVTVQSSLAVDLWICLLGSLRLDQSEKVLRREKAIDYDRVHNCSPISASLFYHLPASHPGTVTTVQIARFHHGRIESRGDFVLSSACPKRCNGSLTLMQFRHFTCSSVRYSNV